MPADWGKMEGVNHPSYRYIAQLVRHQEAWRDDTPLTFPAERADLYFLSVESRHASCLLGHSGYRCEEHAMSFGPEPTEDTPSDAAIMENLRFRYPLLRRSGEAGRVRQLVLFFHGLNERSYTKYVPWAYQLWRSTGAAIALFPLAFHINRVFPRWGQQVTACLRERQAIAGNENVHPFNAVMSKRLGSRPERFFWGGLQTYREVVDLVRLVRTGRHPHVDPSARIDLVGYSAGGYLVLGLLLVDEEELFADSRGVIFESGAALRDTNLSSRLIVDLSAETSLMKLFIRHTDRYANPRLQHFLYEHREGQWFRALCGAPSERARLEARLRALAPRLLGVSNLNDQVIPAGGMLNLLQGIHRDTGVRVEEFDLGVHESPFSCPDYGERDRRFVTHFLDLDRYGSSFEHFIALASAMLS